MCVKRRMRNRRAAGKDRAPQVCLSFLSVRHSFATRFVFNLGLCSILFPYFYLFIFFFFCGKDVVLFPNAAERNFQSFNLSSAVQYYT